MYKLYDLHNDYYLKLKSDSKKERFLDKSENAEHIVTAIWTSELDPKSSFDAIFSAQNFVNRHEKLFLGIEDLHFLDKTNLNRLMNVRPIYAGLTWNNANCLAGGAHESGKITSFGKQVVKILEQNGTIIDTAHLNEESFMDLSKISENPLFCSHTACFGVHNHLRNLKDYQIKMIVDSGGLFGLCLVSDFLSGSKHCNVSDIVAHIDYFACKFGINNLAIGTDFYGTKHLPKGINSYDKLIDSVSKALIKLGYTEKSINKIFFDNANSFFQKLR